jgi:XTP/dITP diphosphohydrolase
MRRIYLATSNPGKVRELNEAAQSFGVELEALPEMKTLPPAIEDGSTFEENARIKAEYYSRFAPSELVLAEDSGLAVEELAGAPGVHSARYAALLERQQAGVNSATHTNSDDEENNRVLISQLKSLPVGTHPGRYLCVMAIAQNGKTLATFVGEAAGELITTPRGAGGFGYDPLFLFPALGKTFAELTLPEKRHYGHRGKAFRSLLQWYRARA